MAVQTWLFTAAAAMAACYLLVQHPTTSHSSADTLPNNVHRFLRRQEVSIYNLCSDCFVNETCPFPVFTTTNDVLGQPSCNCPSNTTTNTTTITQEKQATSFRECSSLLPSLSTDLLLRRIGIAVASILFLLMLCLAGYCHADVFLHQKQRQRRRSSFSVRAVRVGDAPPPPSNETSPQQVAVPLADAAIVVQQETATAQAIVVNDSKVFSTLTTDKP